MLEKKFPEEFHRYLVSIDEVLRHTWEIALCGLVVEKTKLEALQFVIECCKHKMDVIMNPSVVRKSNNTLKPFKRNNHFDADNTKNSDNSCTLYTKKIIQHEKSAVLLKCENKYPVNM